MSSDMSFETKLAGVAVILSFIGLGWSLFDIYQKYQDSIPNENEAPLYTRVYVNQGGQGYVLSQCVYMFPDGSNRVVEMNGGECAKKVMR